MGGKDVAREHTAGLLSLSMELRPLAAYDCRHTGELRLWQWLGFAVDEVVHHDDVVFVIIIRARGGVARGDAHGRDAGVREFDAEE